jgi:hypothetical protein
MRMQTEADRVQGWIESVGEPTLEAEAFALQATLAAIAPARRKRRGSAHARRIPVLVAVVLLLLAISVVALADIGGLFSGAPAPPAVERALLQGSARPPGWLSPRIVADHARELVRTHTAKGDLVLWIAPTSDGNICLALQHPGEQRLAPACVRPGQPAGRLEYAVDALTPGAAWRSIWGRVPARTATLELGFADGTTQPVPVSKGFFVAPLGKRSPSLLVARAVSGSVVARQRVAFAGGLAIGPVDIRPDGSPKVTVAGTARVLIRQRTWAGELTLSSAPSIYGGPCQWVAMERTKTGFSSCQGSLELVDTTQWSLSTSGLHDHFLWVFSAHLPGDRFSGVRFRFADGHVVTLRPHAGWLLYGFPPITMLRAHRPLSMDFLGTDGRVLRHQSFASSYSSMFGAWLHGRHGPRMRRWVMAWSKTHPW